MADRTVELYAALFAALSAHAGLTALIGAGRVHDHVPAGAPLPYVTIGEGNATDDGMSAVDGQVHGFTVHTWTEGSSSLLVKRMIAEVRAALHDQPLTLSAGRLVNLRQEMAQAV